MGAPKLHLQKAGALRKGTHKAGIRGARQQGVHQALHLGLEGVSALFGQGGALRPQGVAPCGLLQVPDQIVELAVLLLLGGDGGGRGAAGKGQRQGQQQAEDASSHGSPSFTWGQRTVNTAPPPDRLAAEILPPRFSRVSRTMESPRPVPPAARERALSTR